MSKTLIQQIKESGNLDKFVGGPGDENSTGEPVGIGKSEEPKNEPAKSEVKTEKEGKPVAKTGGETPPGKTTEEKHPAQIAQEEQDQKEREEAEKAKKTAKTGEVIEPGAAPSFKFKNQEEAEKAALEGQKKISEQGNQIAAQNRELKDLRDKFSKEADREFVSKTIKETTEALAKLDPEDPELITRQTEILFESNQKMLDHKLETFSLKHGTTSPAKSPETIKNDQLLQWDQQVTDYLKTAQLTEPEHKELFWMSFDHLLATDPEFKALANKTEGFGDNEPTKKVVARVKKLIGWTQENLRRVEEENRQASLDNEPLGRGAKKIDTAPEERKPRTLAQAMKDAKGAHRL